MKTKKFDLNDVYGTSDSPIYVYAPPYIEESAGIRCLHLLCHSLNSVGVKSWIVLSSGQEKNQSAVNPKLLTPLLNEDLRDLHFKIGKSPIVIYSETVPGNPLNAQNVVRWIMNYPGILGGPKTFPKSEILVAYSKKIALHLGGNVPVLFLPPVDLREIYETRKLYANVKKTKTVLMYAGKYRGFVGKPLTPKWLNEVPLEIFREGINKQDRNEVMKLLATSRMLISFENSTLITESILLGTPVILIKSTFFDELIAEYELGKFGTSWSDTNNPELVALSHINFAERKYIESVNKFKINLIDQSSLWRKLASLSDYMSPIVIPKMGIIINKHRIRLLFQILITKGPIVLIRVLFSFARRRLSRAIRSFSQEVK